GGVPAGQVALADQANPAVAAEVDVVLVTVDQFLLVRGDRLIAEVDWAPHPRGDADGGEVKAASLQHTALPLTQVGRRWQHLPRRLVSVGDIDQLKPRLDRTVADRAHELRPPQRAPPGDDLGTGAQLPG